MTGINNQRLRYCRMTSSLLVVVSNDRNKCNLHNTVQNIYIKTGFIAINSKNTSLYIFLHFINRLITLWLVAKQPKFTTIFVNVMGITLGMVAMA